MKYINKKNDVERAKTYEHDMERTGTTKKEARES